MLFELCLAVGCPHPDYLQEQLTASQFAEWIAYNAINPINPRERMDMGFARFMGMYATSKAKKGKTFTMADFMPQWTMVERIKLQKKQGWQKIMDVFSALATKPKDKN